MANYKVLSSNCTLGVAGTVIDSADNTDVNYDVLESGGHIEIVKVQAPKPIKESN